MTLINDEILDDPVPLPAGCEVPAGGADLPPQTASALVPGEDGARWYPRLGTAPGVCETAAVSSVADAVAPPDSVADWWASWGHGVAAAVNVTKPTEDSEGIDRLAELDARPTIPDPIAEALRPVRSRRSLSERRYLVPVVAVVLLVVTTAITRAVLVGDDETPPTATASPVVPDGWCPEESSGAFMRSAREGSDRTGMDAFVKLQWSYFQLRSADAAWTVIAPDAQLPPKAEFASAAATVPAGTRHCVAMTALAADRFSAEVTEERPGQPAVVHRELVTTRATPDGRSVIVAITAAPTPEGGAR
ncbi:hypothetical protein [Antrihabitans stalactiti]|uniref:hypothetical protein n=1 Tax=Antrihabitans stalactiti TaxID=2584121 RepID=UPI00146E5AF4|nr:hypothetical protein [Antrihabitans stalactiti]